ncbi:MAG: hypothetical protein HDR80_00530 [Bacteroides sp.]|nr:hypothetical protein [Bacteroides sp.]
MNNLTLTIAVARSRRAKRWSNVEMTWEELRDRLLDVRETQETAPEYRRMSRDAQTEVKDVGGFVGGRLRDGIRKATHVESRSVVTLDYDDFSKERMTQLRDALDQMGVAWAVHSTHKHADYAWRIRLTVPASRPMTGDEYGAVARRVAELVGMTGIDRSTFEACRLMFWGSRSKGAPYVAESSEGDALDVDGMLASYADWRDMSLWPLAPDEETDRLYEASGHAVGAPVAAGVPGRRQEDPTAKKGLVGAFCRTYDIEGAIGRYLPEVYTRKGRNHYTYTRGTTSGGAWVVEDGKFLYSYHSTDPAHGRLLNAWDLVRVHRFGHLDGEEGRGDRLPSFREMSALAMEDGAVRLRLMDERHAEARSDFDGAGAPEEEISGSRPLREDGQATGEAPEAEPAAEAAWAEWDRVRAAKLKPQKDGTLKTTITHCDVVIDGDPRLKGKIWLDDFSGQIMVEGSLPWRRTAARWTNNDDALLRGFLDRYYGLNGAQKVDDALISVANRYGRHPVRVYLEGLEWDGTERLERVFTDVLGAEDTALNRELFRLICVGAVRRIFEPGSKFDYFIIVRGPEGTGKSTLFQKMGGEWFSDSVSSIEGKEGMEAVQGKWIIEMPELTSVKRSEVELLKGFISRLEDKYRPAYGRKEEWRPRQCVMVGTTNEDLFLRGITTGNRRSPVVVVDPKLKKVDEWVGDWVDRWRDQLWAEAVALYRRGYRTWLDTELEKEAKATQDAHNLDKQSVLFPEVDRFLDMWLPEHWEDDYTQAERLKWLDEQGMTQSVDSGGEEPVGFRRREYITCTEILQELLRMKRTDAGYIAKSREMGQYLNSLEGWTFIGPRRNRIYGNQKTWRRSLTTDKTDNNIFGSQSFGSLLDNL